MEKVVEILEERILHFASENEMIPEGMTNVNDQVF